MSFWDNVKKFAHPYSDDEFDEFDDEEMDEGDYPEEEEAEEPAPRTRRRAPVFSSSDDADSGIDFGGASTPNSGASTGSGFNGQVLNMNTGNKQEVVLFHAKTFGDATKAATELRNRKAVILNMENVDKALTRRVVDFLSGCVFALDGKGQKIANATYLFCPHNMEVTGSLDNLQSEVESYI